MMIDINDVLEQDFVVHFSTDEDMDNCEALSYFLEVSGLEDCVIDGDNTSVELRVNGEKVFLSSYGDGDFFSHIVERVLD